MKTLDREELLANLVKNANCPELYCALQRLRTYLPEHDESLSLVNVGNKFGMSRPYSTGVMDGWDVVALPPRVKPVSPRCQSWEEAEYNAGYKFGERMAKECVS